MSVGSMDPDGIEKKRTRVPSSTSTRRVAKTAMATRIRSFVRKRRLRGSRTLVRTRPRRVWAQSALLCITGNLR
jgi:hypothetical protein